MVWPPLISTGSTCPFTANSASGGSERLGGMGYSAMCHEAGVILYKRITLDRRGEVIADKPLLQIVTSWDRLRQMLLRAIDRQRYHFGYTFVHVEQEGSGVRVQFANGGSERADLLVACDGFRSAVRGQVALSWTPRPGR